MKVKGKIVSANLTEDHKHPISDLKDDFSNRGGKYIRVNDDMTGFEYVDTVGGGVAASDIFAGDGVTTQFTLSRKVTNSIYLIVTRNGILQLPVTNYDVTDFTLTLKFIPDTGDMIEVRHFMGAANGSSGGASEDDLKRAFIL